MPTPGTEGPGANALGRTPWVALDGVYPECMTHLHPFGASCPRRGGRPPPSVCSLALTQGQLRVTEPLGGAAGSEVSAASLLRDPRRGTRLSHSCGEASQAGDLSSLGWQTTGQRSRGSSTRTHSRGVNPRALPQGLQEAVPCPASPPTPNTQHTPCGSSCPLAGEDLISVPTPGPHLLEWELAHHVPLRQLSSCRHSQPTSGDSTKLKHKGIYGEAVGVGKGRRRCYKGQVATLGTVCSPACAGQTPLPTRWVPPLLLGIHF